MAYRNVGNPAGARALRSPATRRAEDRRRRASDALWATAAVMALVATALTVLLARLDAPASD